jgi:hypothetical protein
MTLTTLGLSLRDETLIKSLLNVVGANTHAEWRFVDEIDADLALCDPTSPFARMAQQKSERSGRPLCVALLYGDASSSPLLHSIRAPLRVGEFVEMLNGMSEHGVHPPVAAAPRKVAGADGASELSRNPSARDQRLADVVRELIEANDAAQLHAAWRIEIGSVSLDLLLPERRYVLRDNEMTIDVLVDTALLNPVGNVKRLDRENSEMPRSISMSKPLDALLWRIGLRMVPNSSMPWLQSDIVLRLKRWPDFGRLGAQKAHLALAALMTKASWTTNALLETSGQTRDDVQSFLTACGLCGLLDIEHVAAQTVAPPPSRRLGVSGLFRSLRSALRIGS